jgi:hypothetical protein
MNWETVVTWASRLSNGKKFRYPSDEPVVSKIIDDKAHPYGALFRGVGEDADSDEYIVITQSARFNGYKDMDPILIPQFQERDQEAHGRDFPSSLEAGCSFSWG